MHKNINELIMILAALLLGRAVHIQSFLIEVYYLGGYRGQSWLQACVALLYLNVYVCIAVHSYLLMYSHYIHLHFNYIL